jgi:hypothetical protein
MGAGGGGAYGGAGAAGAAGDQQASAQGAGKPGMQAQGPNGMGGGKPAMGAQGPNGAGLGGPSFATAGGTAGGNMPSWATPPAPAGPATAPRESVLNPSRNPSANATNVLALLPGSGFSKGGGKRPPTEAERAAAMQFSASRQQNMLRSSGGR